MATINYRVPGPCTVTWDAASLGTCRDGITITPQDMWQNIVDDKHGTEPASAIFAGKACIVSLLGLDPPTIKAADTAKSMWADIGGLFNLLNSAVGKLASSIAEPLIVTERDGSTTWQANLACPVDPEDLLLASTQELQIPLMYLILPDENMQLFQTVPAYIN